MFPISEMHSSIGRQLGRNVPPNPSHLLPAVHRARRAENKNRFAGSTSPSNESSERIAGDNRVGEGGGSSSNVGQSSFLLAMETPGSVEMEHDRSFVISPEGDNSDEASGVSNVFDFDRSGIAGSGLCRSPRKDGRRSPDQ
jgi:hypothetical protein